MSVIGITGGISTGKTSFCDCLRELIPAAKFFNADEAAHELTQHDAEVKELLRQHPSASWKISALTTWLRAWQDLVWGSDCAHVAPEWLLLSRRRNLATDRKPNLYEGIMPTKTVNLDSLCKSISGAIGCRSPRAMLEGGQVLVSPHYVAVTADL